MSPHPSYPNVNRIFEIIAFNTSQMRIKRIWRVTKSIAGEQRVLTTFIQTEDPNLDDHNTVYDAAIFDSELDAEWCRKHKDQSALDRIGKNVVDKYLRFREPRYSAFTLSRSFFWNKVVHGDPFYAGFSTYLTTNEVANDPRFVMAATRNSRKWRATVASAFATIN